MRTVAIIGGMFGDEGKGLMTDYLCSQMMKGSTKGAVVRFQGGAQSGHTVVTPDGKRHIFSHIGSGALLGLPTILSYKFVCNPHTFLKETNELIFIPEVSIDPYCYITTPYDVLANRHLEISRGDDRHGSVGVGFGETIEREEVGDVNFWYSQLSRPKSHVIKKLQQIREYYFERFMNLDLDSKLLNYISDEKFYEDLCKFNGLTNTFTFVKYDSLIFEGGQGLALDMEYGEFPYVTRSRTGIYHAQEFCLGNNIKLDEVIYLTRSYTTRHGNGPLRNESNEDFKHIVDETNKPNEFQGNLRFAPFDSDMFISLTGKDSDVFNGSVKYMMTCLDQASDKNKILINNSLWELSKEGLIEHAEGTFDYLSYGPTRNHVVENKR